MKLKSFVQQRKLSLSKVAEYETKISANHLHGAGIDTPKVYKDLQNSEHQNPKSINQPIN